MAEQIELMMRQGKLGGMAKGWRSVQYENTEQYVTELLKLELQEREANRINRMVKTAGFRVLKTLDEFVWNSAIELPSGLTQEYMTDLHFLTPKENLIFMGTVGTGKTHLATAIGISCAKARNITYFITFEKLMNQLKSALHENRLETRLKFFAKYKVLIIDEIGYMPIDQDSANLFFQLIARRYEKNSTMITTNMPFSRWAEIFGSATLANAILDRLLHHSSVISIKGPSYKLRDKRELLETHAADE